MAKPSAQKKEKKKKKKDDKPKKKLTFLEVLMRVFLAFVVVLTLLTLVVYWNKKTATAWALQLYADNLVDTLTSEKHYLLFSDQEYRTEFEGKEGEASFDVEELKKRILEKRREEILNAFTELVNNYKFSDNSGWSHAFSGLKNEIASTLQDRSVTAQELQTLLNKTKEYSARYYTPPPQDEETSTSSS